MDIPENVNNKIESNVVKRLLRARLRKKDGSMGRIGKEELYLEFNKPSREIEECRAVLEEAKATLSAKGVEVVVHNLDQLVLGVSGPIDNILTAIEAVDFKRACTDKEIYY